MLYCSRYFIMMGFKYMKDCNSYVIQLCFVFFKDCVEGYRFKLSFKVIIFSIC